MLVSRGEGDLGGEGGDKGMLGLGKEKRGDRETQRRDEWLVWEDRGKSVGLGTT